MIKSFKVSKNITGYFGIDPCNWDNVYLDLLPTATYSMFRPDEIGVVAHHQLSLRWLNFSLDFVYIKTYKVDDEEPNHPTIYY